MAKDKCILAYSGGLDTSVCLKWLQDEKGLDVIAVVGEVGQEHEGLEAVLFSRLNVRFLLVRSIASLQTCVMFS